MSNKIQPVSSFGLEKLSTFDFKEITLSVILSNDGLTFLFLHKNNGIAFEKFNLNPKNFHEIAKSSTSDGKEFLSVNIFFDNRYFALLPLETAKDLDQDNLSKMIFGDANLKSFFHNTKHFDAVFSVEKELFQLVSNQWKDANYQHYAEAFFKNTFENTKGGEEVFFEIRKDFFWAILINNTELKLFNSYDFSGKSDFGFFSLGIINNTKFNTKTLNLWLSGNIEKDSPLESLLKEYVQNIQYFKSKNIGDEYISVQHIINYFTSEN